MNQPTKLLNKNFFLLWQGQTVSKMGTQVFAIGMVLWVMEATKSATIMGLIAMVSSIPALILGPIGGAFADRYSRRGIIVFTDFLNGLAMLSLAVVVYFFPDQTNFGVAWLFFVSIFAAIVNSFFFPAIQASVPDLVPKEKLAGANTLSQFSLQISVLFGQGLGGLLYKFLGAPVIFFLNGISYFFSAGSEAFITIPQQIDKKKNTWRDKLIAFKNDLLAGFHYIWKKAGLRELLLVSTIMNFFITPIIILLPFYVEKCLNVGENYQQWFGYLLAAYGLGNMLGYFLVNLIKLSGKVRGRLMITFIIFESSLYGFMGLADNPYLVTGVAILAGMMNGFTAVNITIILQLTTPSEIRGRVFGLLATMIGAVTPIAMGLSGFIADLINQNYPLIFGLCGMMLALSSAIVALNKNYRTYLAYEHQAEPKTENEPGITAPPSAVVQTNESLV